MNAIKTSINAGRVTAEPVTKKLVILGKGPTARKLPRVFSGEIWEMNTGPLLSVSGPVVLQRGGPKLKGSGLRCEYLGGGPVVADREALRGTRWFQIHIREILDQREEAWLRLCPVPIYTVKVFPDVPMSVRYPIEWVRDMFGADAPFVSSFDFAMALALAERFTEIHLYGVDLGRGSWRERLLENVGHAYWVGRAKGLGVRVTSRSWSHQFPYLYGMQYWEEAHWSINRVAEALLVNANIHDFGANPQALRRLWKMRRGGT